MPPFLNPTPGSNGTTPGIVMAISLLVFLNKEEAPPAPDQGLNRAIVAGMGS